MVGEVIMQFYRAPVMAAASSPSAPNTGGVRVAGGGDAAGVAAPTAPVAAAAMTGSGEGGGRNSP